MLLRVQCGGTFEHLFLKKYFSDHTRNVKRVEFLSFQQGDLSVTDFEAHFGDLARFASDITFNNATQIGHLSEHFDQIFVEK